MHMPPGDVEADELPATHCLWRWTKHIRGKLVVEVLCAHVLFGDSEAVVHVSTRDGDECKESVVILGLDE